MIFCNLFFYVLLDEVMCGSWCKWKNFGKFDLICILLLLNFGGQGVELYCEGGEVVFLVGMVEESWVFVMQVFWFIILVFKVSNLLNFQECLKMLGVSDICVVDMVQGQKQSCFVVWIYFDKKQCWVWCKECWIVVFLELLGEQLVCFFIWICC